MRKHILALFAINFLYPKFLVNGLGSSSEECIENVCNFEEYVEHAENILNREVMNQPALNSYFKKHYLEPAKQNRLDARRTVGILDRIVICQKVASGMLGQKNNRRTNIRTTDFQCIERTCSFHEYVEVMENDFGKAIAQDRDLISVFEKYYTETVKKTSANSIRTVKTAAIGHVNEYLVSTMNYYDNLCEEDDSECDCVKKASETRTSQSDLQTGEGWDFESNSVISTGGFIGGSNKFSSKNREPTSRSNNSPDFKSVCEIFENLASSSLSASLSNRQATTFINNYFQRYVDFTGKNPLIDGKQQQTSLSYDRKVELFQNFFGIDYNSVQLANFINNKVLKFSKSGNRLNLANSKPSIKFCKSQKSGKMCTVYYENSNTNSSLIIDKALCLWSKNTNINFLVSSYDETNKIDFYQDKKLWSQKFRTNQFGIKHALGYSYHKEVHFNPIYDMGEEESVILENCSNKDFKLNNYYEVLHRIGLSLGLKQSNNPQSVMYPYLSVQLQDFFYSDDVQELPKVDIKNIQKLYGGRRRESSLWYNNCGGI